MSGACCSVARSCGGAAFCRRRRVTTRFSECCLRTMPFAWSGRAAPDFDRPASVPRDAAGSNPALVTSGDTGFVRTLNWLSDGAKAISVDQPSMMKWERPEPIEAGWGCCSSIRARARSRWWIDPPAGAGSTSSMVIRRRQCLGDARKLANLGTCVRRFLARRSDLFRRLPLGLCSPLGFQRPDERASFRSCSGEPGRETMQQRLASANANEGGTAFERHIRLHSCDIAAPGRDVLNRASATAVESLGRSNRLPTPRVRSPG